MAQRIGWILLVILAFLAILWLVGIRVHVG